MKTTLALLLLFAAVPARALVAPTYSANFDTLSPSDAQQLIVTQGSLTFASPSGFQIITGSLAATSFGWGGYVYQGNALAVYNAGWVDVAAGGSAIDSLSFKYGFDWNGYLIEYGLLETTFGWQALANGVVVDAGSVAGGAHFHGGAIMTVNPLVDFDTLQIRSTAVAWAGTYNGSGYTRGAVIGYGPANHIAFDDVSVTLAASAQFFATQSVPDGRDGSLVLLCCAMGVLAFFKRLYVS